MGLKRRRTALWPAFSWRGLRLAVCPFVASGSAGLWEWTFVTGRSLCHHLSMAKTVIVKLTDDIDGGDADETIQFALDGKSYEVDLSTTNASKLRDALKPYIENGRGIGSGARVRSSRPSGPPTVDTLYSQLSDDEKTRFRSVGRHADGSTDQ